MTVKGVLFLYVLSLNYSLSYRTLLHPQCASSLIRCDSRSTHSYVRGVDSSVRMSLDSETADFGTRGRLLLSGIALTGAMETAFLTYSKFTSTPLGNLCSNPGSCSSVLDGPWSTVPFFNIPLSAFAFLGYTLVALLSIAPLVDKNTDTAASRSILLFTISAMVSFSLYLMTLLAGVIHTSCNFCYLSATLTVLMAGIVWSQKVVPNPTKALLISASSVAITFVTSGFLFYTTSTLLSDAALASNIPSTQATIILADAKVTDSKPPQEPPKILKNSSPRALLIGERLKAMNAKMYGAFWCSHCNNQKQELGIEAAKLFEYVECAKDGINSQYAICKEEKIPGFPTWEIKGELYPGEKNLSELEKLLTDIEKKSVVVVK